MNGEPKSSIITSMNTTEKPRPMNSGEPKGSKTSPALQHVLPPHTSPGMGMILLMPVSVPFSSLIVPKPTRSYTEFAPRVSWWFFQFMSAHTAPPPQYFMPVPVRPAPEEHHRDAGNERERLRSASLGMNARKISTKQHTMTVPSIFPYASSGSTPSAFIAAMPASKTGRKPNERAQDGEHAGAEDGFGPRDGELHAVDDGADARDDEGRRDGVLLKIGVDEVDAELHDHERRNDETCDGRRTGMDEGGTRASENVPPSVPERFSARLQVAIFTIDTKDARGADVGCIPAEMV